MLDGVNRRLKHPGIGITAANRNDLGCHHSLRVVVGELTRAGVSSRVKIDRSEFLL
jgi:hypothetical protein